MTHITNLAFDISVVIARTVNAIFNILVVLAYNYNVSSDISITIAYIDNATLNVGIKRERFFKSQVMATLIGAVDSIVLDEWRSVQASYFPLELA